MSWEEFKAQDLAYFNKGLRIVTLLRDVMPDISYAAFWRPGTGAQWFHPNLGAQKFHDLNQKYFNQGLRLKVMPLWGLCGLWVPGSGAQWVHINLSGDEIHDQDQTYFAQGLRLVDIKRGVIP